MESMKQGVAAVEHCDCEYGPNTCRKVHPDRCVTPNGTPTTPHSGRWRAGGHYADGYNSLLPELDEAQKQIESLNARIAELENTPTPTPTPTPEPTPAPTPTPTPEPTPTPAPTVTELSNFTVNQSAMQVPWDKGLVGDGTGRTTYHLKEKSSTYAAAWATLVKPATTPYRMLLLGGFGANQVATGLEFGGFTVEGSNQGHPFHLIRLGYSEAAHLHDIVGKSGYGNAPGPPGETFMLALWHANNAKIERVYMDGRDINGASVAATVLGLNTLSGGTTTNSSFSYGSAGFAAALWQTRNHRFVETEFSHSRKLINIECAVGGTLDFDGCKFSDAQGAPYVAQVSAISSGAVTGQSVKLTFRDPVLDTWPLRVRTYPAAAGNAQKDSDVKLFINGNDVSADPSKLLLTHSG